jgi:hypothetical protein
MSVAAQLGIAPHLIGLRTAPRTGKAVEAKMKNTTKNAPEEIASANVPLMTHWLGGPPRHVRDLGAVFDPTALTAGFDSDAGSNQVGRGDGRDEASAYPIENV